MKAHDAFRHWRVEQARMSQAQAGEGLGLSQAVVSKMERGKWLPDEKLRLRIERFTGLNRAIWDESEEVVPEAVSAPQVRALWVAAFRNEVSYHFIAQGVIEAAQKAVAKTTKDAPVVSLRFVGLVDVD